MALPRTHFWCLIHFAITVIIHAVPKNGVSLILALSLLVIMFSFAFGVCHLSSIPLFLYINWPDCRFLGQFTSCIQYATPTFTFTFLKPFLHLTDLISILSYTYWAPAVICAHSADKYHPGKNTRARGTWPIYLLAGTYRDVISTSRLLESIKCI